MISIYNAQGDYFYYFHLIISSGCSNKIDVYSMPLPINFVECVLKKNIPDYYFNADNKWSI